MPAPAAPAPAEDENNRVGRVRTGSSAPTRIYVLDFRLSTLDI